MKVSMWECYAIGTVRLHRRESPLKYTGVCLRGVHSPVSRIKAAFKLSSEPFDGADRIEWALDGGSVAYVEGIVMLRDAPVVIFDVLHDFMVISCMERGFEVMRLKDAVLADYLSEEEDYRLCGKAGRYSYFEVDVKNFE